MNLRKIACFLSGMLLISSAWAQILGPSTWTWMKGTDTTNRNGIYGIRGVPDPANNPGARDAAGTWTDTAGKFWLFGGEGRPATGTSNIRMSDLWRYDPVTNEWTWMHGDTAGAANAAAWRGVYGTKGIPDPANKPGGRYRFPTWTDKNGDFWLFGGYGRAATATGSQNMNDLWKYTVATGEWTWVSGDDIHSVNGVFGTKGVAAPTNKPGAKDGAAGWVDKDDNFWIFGGLGRGASGTSTGAMNDLWKYDPGADVWTWMHGDSIITPDSVYGIKGVADPANKPAARRYASTWTDTEGNLWLFGGQNWQNQSMNDLWKYNIATNEWMWVHGDSSLRQFGSYAVPHVADPSNKPGARISAAAWQGPDGYFWLFGGSGYASEIITSDPWAMVYGYLNDLWLYDVAANEWTWVSGDSVFGVKGIYGTQGVADPTNKPGTRYLPSGGWKDDKGDIWMFGGTGRSRVSNTDGRLDDVWRFDVCFLITATQDIAGADTICRNSVFTYTIPPIAHATSYNWTLPAGWTGTSSSNSITANVGMSGGMITVQAVNDCDTGQIQSLNVFVPAFEPVQINVDSNVLSTTSPYVVYQWYKNGDSIPGAMNAAYTVTENASYTVKVADIYGCEDSSTAYIVNNVSVPSVYGSESGVSVYPNPARSMVYIDMNKPRPVHVTMWRMDGGIVFQQDHARSIDVSDFAAGVYFIQISAPEGERLYHGKLVITGR